MQQPKQIKLKDLVGKTPKTRFGGSLNTGKRKEARPLASRSYIHMVIRSPMATKKYSMLRKGKQIEAILRAQAQKNHIELKDYTNVGNHIHLLIRIIPRGAETKRAFARFSRAITGLIARVVLGAQKNAAVLKAGQSFWPLRPFTRILSNTKSDFKNIRRYFLQNLFEAIGIKKEVSKLFSTSALPSVLSTA